MDPPLYRLLFFDICAFRIPRCRISNQEQNGCSLGTNLSRYFIPLSLYPLLLKLYPFIPFSISHFIPLSLYPFIRLSLYPFIRLKPNFIRWLYPSTFSVLETLSVHFIRPLYPSKLLYPLTLSVHFIRPRNFIRSHFIPLSGSNQTLSVHHFIPLSAQSETLSLYPFIPLSVGWKTLSLYPFIPLSVYCAFSKIQENKYKPFLLRCLEECYEVRFCGHELVYSELWQRTFTVLCSTWRPCCVHENSCFQLFFSVRNIDFQLALKKPTIEHKVCTFLWYACSPTMSRNGEDRALTVINVLSPNH